VFRPWWWAIRTGDEYSSTGGGLRCVRGRVKEAWPLPSAPWAEIERSFRSTATRVGACLAPSASGGETRPIRQLQRALLDRGHDVTRTPNDWMPSDADDESQLLGPRSGPGHLHAQCADYSALAQNAIRIIALAAQRPMGREHL